MAPKLATPAYLGIFPWFGSDSCSDVIVRVRNLHAVGWLFKGLNWLFIYLDVDITTEAGRLQYISK